MSDRKRPGPAPQNPLRASLYDSGWDEAPPARAPEYSGTAHTLPRTEHTMDSITQEVDDLLEVDEEPSAPAPSHQRPSPSVRARPVVGIGAPRTHSLGDEELEAALQGRSLGPGAPPTGLASRSARPAAKQGADPLPRFSTDDSQPAFRPTGALPGFDDPTDELFMRSLSTQQPAPAPAFARAPSTAPARGVVHAPPHAPPKSTPPPRPLATPAPPRPPSAPPPAPVAPRGATLPPQGMTGPPSTLLPPLSQVSPVAPVSPLAAPPLPAGNRQDPTLITRAPRLPRAGFSKRTLVALALVTLGIGAAGVILAAGAFGGASSEPSASASPPEEGTAASQAPEQTKSPEPEPKPAEPERKTTKAPSGGSLLERAAEGDEAALTKLEERASGERSAEEALAVAAGRSALRLRAAKELRQKLARDAKLASDPEVVKALREHAVDIETQREALAAMAELPDERSADLLYEVWTRTPRRTPATELAESLLRSKDVRPKASKQVALAIELRDEQVCEKVPALLERVMTNGDRRALPPLMRFLSKGGCGPNKRADCFPCLGKRDTVREAIKAVRERREPKL